MALSAHNRVRSDRDIRAILKQGKTVHGSFFFLKVLENGGLPSRAAVVVSGKISRKATERNRMKRVLTEAMRERLSRGHDIVCVVKKNFLADSDASRSEFLKIWSKIS